MKIFISYFFVSSLIIRKLYHCKVHFFGILTLMKLTNSRIFLTWYCPWSIDAWSSLRRRYWCLLNNNFSIISENVSINFDDILSNFENILEVLIEIGSSFNKLTIISFTKYRKCMIYFFSNFISDSFLNLNINQQLKSQKSIGQHFNHSWTAF